MKITGVLTWIFIVLKLLGVISWSWWVVFSPIILSLMLWLIITIVFSWANGKINRRIRNIKRGNKSK